MIWVFFSNLIGSLTRAIQLYSPPSELIMRELGVFPIFFRNDLSKFNKILAYEETSKDSKQRFAIYISWFFLLDECLQLLFVQVKETVLRTQRFLTRKILPKNRSLFIWQTTMKANICGNSTLQVNRTKNASGKRPLTWSNRAAISALHAKNEHKKPFH